MKLWLEGKVDQRKRMVALLVAEWAATEKTSVPRKPLLREALRRFWYRPIAYKWEPAACRFSLLLDKAHRRSVQKGGQ